MRPRSGGIHSSSQRQYIQLADIAQECKSLFYDEPKVSPTNKRRKYAFAVNNAQIQSQYEAKDKQIKKSSSKAFENFNFDQQSYNFAKDCENLKKKEEETMKKISKNNFVIITNKKTAAILKMLESCLGMENQMTHTQDRAINLFIHHFNKNENEEQYIDCFWIINNMHSSRFGALFEVYINKSSKVLDLSIIQPQNCDTESVCQKSFQALRSMISKIASERQVINKQQA